MLAVVLHKGQTCSAQKHESLIVSRSLMGGGRSRGAVGQGLPMEALCAILVKQAATLIRYDEQSTSAGWITQSTLLSVDVPAAPEIKSRWQRGEESLCGGVQACVELLGGPGQGCRGPSHPECLPPLA